jgi:amidohydrolase
MSTDRKEFHRWLIDFRRDLHRHPEIAYQEIRTTEKIKTALEELSLKVKTFDDMTGCTTLIQGDGEGPTLGLRADIDALPLSELNEVDYKSVNEGTMHACGHDSHATIILGVAKYVIESGLAEKINGAIKLLFQPAEEGGAGAKAMIDRGALENPNVDWMIGSHVVPFAPTGQVGVFVKEALASTDKFVIDIQGAGAHGSRPHESKDPILAAAHIIVAAQSIVSRNLDPSDVGVVSFGAVESGTTHNIIPATAKLTGTIRSFKHKTRDLLINRLEYIVLNIGQAFSVECSVSIP